MVLKDKYQRENSRRYRSTHGGIRSNQQVRSEQQPTGSKSDQSNFQEKKFPSLRSESSTTKNSRDNGSEEEEDDQHFRRRELTSNSSRYDEPQSDPDQGMSANFIKNHSLLLTKESEPEIDLTNFLEKQKAKEQSESYQTYQQITSDKNSNETEKDRDQDDVDESFDGLYKHSVNFDKLKKSSNKVLIDPSSLGLEELNIERQKTDATRELLARFTGRSDVPISSKRSITKNIPLTKNQTDDLSKNHSSTSKNMILPIDDEDFLDEVLNDSSWHFWET
ncbi:hypothetical protein PPACK8108_LOCUS24168 [Phakopsora pachyrhizi]|uniref:Uncharacterized protein n=1 Tax=Phakopsora pachyrhizi TaxID=170000 RepID=A0AAV0BPY7_PHAPC|nr:hypothetical protein PPACK8108_LOCUS24168 [Phakopsora pachyrhizi]